jgi:hypothetical protein
MSPGRFACHGRCSGKIESAAVGAAAAKSWRFYRLLERSNALNCSGLLQARARVLNQQLRSDFER